MTKKEAGRLGGLSTFNKYGKDHMRKIGRNGAIEFYKKYKLVPIYTSQFAIVRKSDNKIIAFW